MKPSLHLCCAILLGGFALSSCSSLDLADEDNALEPGVKYEVRHALPMDAPAVPKNIPTRYFMVDAPAPDSGFAEAVHHAEPSERTVRTTAYCQSESDHLRWGNFAAAGAPLRFGVVCSAAADWSRYPLGTRFRIKSQPDVIYEVDDYGSALVGSGTIDLYRPTMGSMNAWGVRNVDIEILKWGSFEDSMKLMRDRLKYPHVRHMMADIKNKLDPSHTPVVPPLVEVPASAPSSIPVVSGPPLADAGNAPVSL